LLTNDRGRFSTAGLPAGVYSIKVTLAGFLPALDQHVQVDADRATRLQIVLGSVFSSIGQLRRQPDQPVSADDWTWVLRASAATRPVLRWQEDPSGAGDPQATTENSSGAQTVRARLDLTSGGTHPGSISNVGDSPATSFAYDLGLGASGQLLMAGQFSQEDGAGATSLATEWLPSGQPGAGPATTMLVRESHPEQAGPVFRGMRLSHDDQFLLTDAFSVRYGAEYLVAELNGTTSAIRPRGEIAMQLTPVWLASAIVVTRPWQEGGMSESALESALNTLDAFPTILIRDGRSVLENGLHEELGVTRTLNGRADLSAAVFHDRSTHTAVMGRGGAASPDYLQDYFSAAFAYDGGVTSSTGARVAYRQKCGDHCNATIVYSYAGALAPNGSVPASELRDQLATQYRHSVAARVSTTVPRFGTRFSAGYKWLSGTIVSQQDPYGESLYHTDPYLSFEVRQPLPSLFPGHMEVQADVGNLLAQGYISLATADGSVVLVPNYRYFRGGLSLQF